MTIYCQEGRRGTKKNPRCAKFPSLSRKRNSLKSLPPIYEIDEDCEETEFLDATNKDSHQSGTLGKACRDYDGKYFQENNNVHHEEHCEVNKTRKQHQNYREFPVEGRKERKETYGYPKRNLGRNSSVTSRAEGNNQMVFPDFFPPGMHVHCARNALPEASKGLYMKIMQGEAEMMHERNVCKTSMSTGSHSSNKQQNWMQFFG